ncbi:MAG: glycerophosphodiester phosphodiesterase family protein [Chloroflexota bacterium]|nr:glycerophosphodiester phosphodiesterase family protein [Chloroflexota bacterium]
MTPRIFAHRGASTDAPENTMAAFQLALDQNADGIELDAMLSGDGCVVVIHDDTVDRTTNGSGRVREMTLEQIKSLDAGRGERIPTLEEVLECFGGKFLINIELKNYASIFDALPIKVAKLINNFGLVDSVIISSFNPINFRRVRRLLPDITIGLLTQPNQAKFWIWRMFRYDALHPHYSDVDETLVETLHAQGRQVNVWTADDAEEVLRLAALHVDGIITNFPQRAREILES